MWRVVMMFCFPSGECVEPSAFEDRLATLGNCEVVRQMYARNGSGPVPPGTRRTYKCEREPSAPTRS